METPRARFVPDGDGSRGSSPVKEGHDLYPDIANKWAPGAHPERPKSYVTPCLQLSLYVLGLSIVLTLLGVYCYADRKLGLVQGVLEPKAMEERSELRCDAPEDLVDYAAAVNGGRVVVEESSPSYHGLILVRQM